MSKKTNLAIPFAGQRVFVCSPYRACRDYSTKENVEIAQEICQWVLRHGGNPMAPHLYYPVNGLLDAQLLDDTDAVQRQKGLQFAREWIQLCEYMVVLTDRISPGMRDEIAFATTHAPTILAIERNYSSPRDYAIRSEISYITRTPTGAVQISARGEYPTESLASILNQAVRDSNDIPQAPSLFPHVDAFSQTHVH